MNDYISNFVNKNCLVTGGAGFIGSNLSRFLAIMEPSVKITLIQVEKKTR